MPTFNFTFEPGVTVQQALGFEMAGRIWSSYLSDPGTINIHVGISNSLPTNAIGGSLPGILANVSYGSVVNPGLQRDQKSNDDRLAYSRIFNTGSTFYSSYDVPVLLGTQKLVLPSTTMNMTRANAKAIGAISPNDTALDSAIVLGTLAGSSYSWNYDFTRSSSTPSGSLDFLSVAMHELGHALGFTSSVDTPGSDFSKLSIWGIPPEVQQLLQQRSKLTTPLDLLRSSFLSFAQGASDLSYGKNGGSKFFSLDRIVQLGEFSTGKNTSAGGNGYQASHWDERSLLPLGIMDPAIGSREQLSISNLDLQALDVIGWDLSNGLSAGTLSTAFLTAIRDQAVQALSQRLGQSTTWVNSNLGTSPSNLGRDRTVDVSAMIANSQIYGAGGKGSGSGSTTPRTWMEAYTVMANNQEVYVNFETLSDHTDSDHAGSDHALEDVNANAGGSRSDAGDSLLGAQAGVGGSSNLTSDAADSLTHYQPPSLPYTGLSNRSGKSSQFHSDEQPHRRRRGSNSLRNREPKADLTQADFGEAGLFKRRQQARNRALAQPTEGTPQRLELTPNSLGASAGDRTSSNNPFWKYREMGDFASQPLTAASTDNSFFNRLCNFF